MTTHSNKIFFEMEGLQMKEIERFNEAVVANKEMLEEIKAIGHDLNKMVAYANSKGFKFTIEDLEVKNKNSDELSEEELDEVVGGMFGLLQIIGGHSHKKPKSTVVHTDTVNDSPSALPYTPQYHLVAAI